jgi:ADP-ribosyl-[dinitrogen reductase] hydrolase
MALCLDNSLVARRDFVPYDQLVRYKWWSLHGYMSSTGHCFDIGAATSQSIHEFQVRQKHFGKKHQIPPKQIDYLSDPELLSEFDVYCSDPDAAGNGSLMRLAPVPLFFYRNKYAAIEFSGRSGEVTHGNKKAYDACRFYGALIVAALRGFTKKQILAPNFYSKHRHWFGEEPLCQEIISIAEGSYKRVYGYEGGIRGKGYVVQALEAALWAFWSDADSFEKGVLNAVNLGDDTDTTAAIYGQLAGAYYGYKQLPQNWVQHLYGVKYMRTLSKWIAYEGEQWDKNRENSFVKGSIGRN